MKDTKYTFFSGAKWLTSLLRVLVVLLLAGVSCSVMATTYYLRYDYTDGSSEHYDSGSYNWATSDGSGAWSSQNLQEGNNYIYIGTSESYSSFQWLNNWKNQAGGITPYAAQYDGHQGIKLVASAACTVNLSYDGTYVTITGGVPVSTDLYVAGNGTASNLYNWCGGRSWVVNGSPMIGTPKSVTFNDVYTTVANTGAVFQLTNGTWEGKKDNSYWDGNVSDIVSGVTITTESGASSTTNTKIVPTANVRYNITITYNSETDRYHLTIVESASSPTVYMGEKLTKGAGEVMTGSVYLAQTGGATVTDITVYYSLGSTPTSLSPSVKLTGPFSCGNLYSFTVDDFCAYGSGDYQFMAVATNAAGSGNSDVVSAHYECCHGAINDFTISTVSDYVLKGDNVGFITSMTGGGAEPEYSWSISLDNGSSWEDQEAFDGLPMMYYVVPSDVLGGSDIKVKVVATGSNCEDTRTLIKTVTVCSTPAISGWSASERTPAWTDADISATVTDADKVDWTVTPTANILEKSYSSSTASAKFRGGTPKGTTTTYTITINATEDNCSTSTSDSIEIEVTSDADGC